MTDTQAGTDRSIEEAELQAYLDGELSAVRRAEIEAYLSERPAVADRLNDYAELTLAMHSVYGQTSNAPNAEIDVLTARLRRRISRRKIARGVAKCAAASVLALIGVVAVSSYTGEVEQPEDRFLAFTRQATDAHMLFAGRVSEVLDAEPMRKSRVVSWLSQRLTGIPLQAPDLRPFGYDLAVERILPSGNGPAAQLMYEHKKDKRPITLFIGKNRNAAQTAFTFARNRDVSIFYWQEGPFAYSLAGRFERKPLLKLAEEVSSQLTAVPPLPRPFVQRRDEGDPGRRTASAQPTTPEEPAKVAPVAQPVPATAPAPAAQPVSDSPPPSKAPGDAMPEAPKAPAVPKAPVAPPEVADSDRTKT